MFMFIVIIVVIIVIYRNYSNHCFIVFLICLYINKFKILIISDQNNENVQKSFYQY